MNAQVELPSIFGSNMVIQRNNDVSIWGSGPARSEIVVTTSWNGSTYTTKTDKEGNWILKVKTTNAGGPYQVDISNGGETVSLENVMIGEVWVCSGQSNMERPLKGAGNDPVIGANEAILRSENPNIRFFKVENEKSSEPKTDFSGEWELCSRKTAPDFSATGYFFGNLVQEIIDVPVGLIASDWGATRIQFWMDEGSLNQFDPEDHKNSATTLFNGMIHPMLGFNIRGVVWYQGESNRYNPGIYKDMMVEMVKGWRAKWGIGEFPFYYCQIAPYKYTNELNTALLREAQLMASKEIPNSGMACLLDAGDENYIHPSKKRIAGERLAYLALKNTYGVSGIHAEGPEFVEMKIDSSSVELTFDKKLTSFGRDLKLFELAGEDKKFYPAKAVIHKNTVIVTSEDVLKPIAARYGFKNFVDGDLFDRYGIPASSFRTDDW
ncbi:MAG: sialate O-acetylesterase [Cyclobacteriaceae bacterium]